MVVQSIYILFFCSVWIFHKYFLEIADSLRHKPNICFLNQNIYNILALINLFEIFFIPYYLLNVSSICFGRYALFEGFFLSYYILNVSSSFFDYQQIIKLYYLSCDSCARKLL